MTRKSGNKTPKSSSSKQSKVADKKLQEKSEAVCRDLSTLQKRTMEGANVFDYLQIGEPATKGEEKPDAVSSKEDDQPAAEAENVTIDKIVETKDGKY